MLDSTVLTRVRALAIELAGETGMGILQGKTIIVTGSNRGIGSAVVSACASQGANVWACARRQSEKFENTLNELSVQHNVRCRPLYFDMNDRAAMKVALKQVRDSGQSVDGLVNNAGIIAKPSSFVMTKTDTMRQVMETNFFALTELTQLVVRMMLRQEHGSIVNMASIAALDGAPGQYEYAASKGAVIGATKELAVELGPRGIRVNAIAPGVIQTEMGMQMSDELMRSTLDRTALHRLGEAEEIAGAVAYLLSDLSAYITGQIFRVDGGGL